MTGIGDLIGTVGRLAGGALSLARIAPEPRSRNGASFSTVARSLSSDYFTSDPGFGQIMGQYQDLINTQIETQTQMQLVSMESNILKSEHETQMAAIRNVRVG